MSIEINQINKSFGRTPVLNDISLDIPSGQMVALLGPSGSGKTTLLRIIAGLEHQNSGQIRFHNKDVSALHARDQAARDASAGNGAAGASGKPLPGTALGRAEAARGAGARAGGRTADPAAR